ncbi:hypothetical protein DPEC_G00174700 [Dallia pectoralis]|uniref:Uncharacterized protein n=1 Tax=Dallia pectoralis TaxID=75939 RepID=A0ACC2GEL6_DALPE|nr:hypothetical protein DPEC_G00174700 [Dallia pectoralis]
MRPHVFTLATPMVAVTYPTTSALMDILLRLTGVWAFFVSSTVIVSCEVQFMGKQTGDSVTFVCVADSNNSKPKGIYLKRKWLQHMEVMFMNPQNVPVVSSAFQQRLHVTQDPIMHSRVNVTIGQLQGNDTDLYYCQFVFTNDSSMFYVPGKEEYFLYVDHADVPDTKLDVGLVKTNAGDSVVLPCLSPYGTPSAIAGVCLKRRQGRAPVEMLFHSKHPSAFPKERVLLQVTVQGGLAYNISLTQMQPDESAFYSCELLVPGMTESHTRLGRHVYFVSVQDVSCSCSGYGPLLYALSAAVGLLLVILLALGVAHCGKIGSNRVKPQPSVYEEMVGVCPQNRNRKVAPSYLRPPLHLEEMNASAYDHPPDRSRQENVYEKPDATALIPAETAGLA